MNEIRWMFETLCPIAVWIAIKRNLNVKRPSAYLATALGAPIRVNVTFSVDTKLSPQLMGQKSLKDFAV
jgi:hypothetical protein